MKRPFSAINESVQALAAGPLESVNNQVDETDMTDVEEHSALEVELDRGDAILDSLKFVKRDRLRWLSQTSSADAIVNALNKCGLSEGDALSRKRRRYERLGSLAHDSLMPALRKGKAVRRAPCGSRKRLSQVQTQSDKKDPLIKLRVFKEMKKNKAKARMDDGQGKGKGKHVRTESSSTDHSLSDVEDGIFEDDERMDLSDIEWYTRQDFGADDEPRTPRARTALLDDEEDDDLDMSEVELDVLASPMSPMSISPERKYRPAFVVPVQPVISVPELNSVPCCLYRPTADIIEEVYDHLGLDKTDRRGIKALNDLLDVRTGMSRPKYSRQELGSSGVFSNRPTLAKDWAALILTRKIIRRDRLAKSAIYRFTFRFPKEQVPMQFMKWQTWNHPTLAEIKNGLRLKLDEQLEPAVTEEEQEEEEEEVEPVAPSSPAMVESELGDGLDDIPEIDDILSVANELESESDEEDETSSCVSVFMRSHVEIEVTPEMDDQSELTETETEDDDEDNRTEVEEEAQFFQALGLSGMHEEEQSPGYDEFMRLTRRAPIYSRLPRARQDSDEPPSYAPRNYRDQSPTPPPPFNAQTDNDVIILPRFSPLAAASTVLPRLLPAFEGNTTNASARIISPLPTPRRSRNASRNQRRVVSGEIVIPGAFAAMRRPQTPPTPSPAPRRLPVYVSGEEAFQHALDMEEAETALDLFEDGSEVVDDPEGGRPGVLGWGSSLVRSWWRR